MNSDTLFADNVNQFSNAPLAARMRPRNLDEYIGQERIVGKGRLLRRAIKADRLASLIFYGPPGTGKTTLARVIANHTKSNFLSLNAVLAGVQQIRDAITTADENKKLYDRRTILFVDEVHRWNKSQQDALLPWVENGTIILIGATTENPFFEVNKALVSRSRVFRLEVLTDDDLLKIAQLAISDRERGYGKWTVKFEDNSLEHLIKTASGDARSLLNALELAIETTPDNWPPPENTEILITKQIAEESIQQKAVLYDKDGDYHYDIISAFIKSIRGSDPDAALYWLARMVSAGEDPHFIFRRLLISACEDIGLAEPSALTIVTSAAEAFDRVGLPEGRYHLAHATLYLATCPKSNSSLGFFDALHSIEKEDHPVPLHLRDASRDKEALGHGKNYLYPHAYKDHWVAQQYLPNELSGQYFYKPSRMGYEAKITEQVMNKREAQLASFLELDNIKTENKTDWIERTETNIGEILESVRNTLFEKANLDEYTRALIYNADNNLLLWSVARKTTESITCAFCKTEKAKNVLEQYGKSIELIAEPILQLIPNTVDTKNLFPENEFDVILSWLPATNKSDFELFFNTIKQYLQKNTKILFAVKNPATSIKLHQYLPHVLNTNERTDTKIKSKLEKLETAEKSFFENPENKFFNWNNDDIINIAKATDIDLSCDTQKFTEKRTISQMELSKWFSDKSPYGQHLRKTHTPKEIAELKNLFDKHTGKTAKLPIEIYFFASK